MTQPSTSEQLQTNPRAQLRRQLLQMRQVTPVATRQTWDQQIATQVFARVIALGCQRLAIYWPIKGEPDLQTCYQALHQHGVQLALPVVLDTKLGLRFIPWAPGDAMELDDYGIPIPKQRNQELAIDTLLIPCVGFTTDRYRLGYGGGYYDRSLAQMPQAHTIGIAYQQAQINFSQESYDIAMHCIVTETGII